MSEKVKKSLFLVNITDGEKVIAEGKVMTSDDEKAILLVALANAEAIAEADIEKVEVLVNPF